MVVPGPRTPGAMHRLGARAFKREEMGAAEGRLDAKPVLLPKHTTSRATSEDTHNVCASLRGSLAPLGTWLNFTQSPWDLLTSRPASQQGALHTSQC